MASTYLNLNEGQLELKAQAIITKKRNLDTDDIDNISDNKWLKQSFLIKKGAVTDEEKINRIYSSAEFKFADSSIGGNYVINPPPQYTRYADARVKGRVTQRHDVTLNGSSINLGMGHYYSEALDDNSQVIHMRFGVPQFNALTTFFTGFFDPKAGLLARTGRGDASFFRAAGQFAGFVVFLLTWPIWAASLIGTIFRFALQKPSSKFSYLKPLMPIYWQAVTNMVNQIATNKGIFPFDSNESQNSGEGFKVSEKELKDYATMMPLVFSENGAIDVYGIANRAQSKKNKMDKELNQIYGNADTYEGLVKQYEEINPDTTPGDRGTIESFVNKWLETEVGQPPADDKGDFERSMKVDENGEPKALTDRFLSLLNSEYTDGSAFASFRVDSTGSVQESFSSSIVESDLASKFNSISSSNKAAYYSFAGGNVIGGVVGAAVNGVKNAVTDFVSGGLDAFNIGGLLALGGSAFVDIPKHWESSTANLPKSTYTMTLISPYGNPVSQMINIYIPLCMILVGALPLATGRQSYTSPFCVEYYDRGRQQSRYGIIDSVSVTRGTSNLGFNKEGNAMAVEVSFSIADLSSIMSIPIASKTFLQNLNLVDGIMDDDNVYTDYLNVLSSLSMYDQYYTMSKLKLRTAQRMKNFTLFTSPARTAMFIRHNVGILDIFFKGAQRDNGSITGGSGF